MIIIDYSENDKSNVVISITNGQIIHGQQTFQAE